MEGKVGGKGRQRAAEKGAGGRGVRGRDAAALASAESEPCGKEVKKRVQEGVRLVRTGKGCKKRSNRLEAVPVE